MNAKELYEIECKNNEKDILNGIIVSYTIFIKGDKVSRFVFNKNKKGIEKELKSSALNNGVDAYIVIRHGDGKIFDHNTGEVVKASICARTLYTKTEKLMTTISYTGTKIIRTDEWNGRGDSYDPYDCWNETEPIKVMKKIKDVWK